MLENAFARLERQVQAVKLGVALLQVIDHTQALQVVLKAAKVGHAGVERVLAGVAKRRVTQVVRQRDGFNQVFVEPQGAGDGSTELRHLQRMGEPGAKQVALVVQKDLGLIDQTPESRAVHNAIAVALVIGAGGRWRLGVAPPARG